MAEQNNFPIGSGSKEEIRSGLGIGLMGLLRNFTGAASDKEVEFLKDALPTKERKPIP